MSDYTTKIDRLFSFAAELGFTEQDFAQLAVAAADQAMVSVKRQEQIRALVAPVCRICDRSIGDYNSTEKDAKVVDPERLCEDCHGELVRGAKRQRRVDVEEARGDYLRDQQKGER